MIVDAMHMVHKWSFLKGETFEEISRRYKRNLFSGLPEGTGSVHFCCDRYDKSPSLKSSERQQRQAGKKLKKYQVKGNLQAPTFRDFVSSSENKASLLQFLCETWAENQASSVDNTKDLYLSG